LASPLVGLTVGIVRRKEYFLRLEHYAPKPNCICCVGRNGASVHDRVLTAQWRAAGRPCGALLDRVVRAHSAQNGGSLSMDSSPVT
jgi:hypothetical protein